MPDAYPWQDNPAPDGGQSGDSKPSSPPPGSNQAPPAKRRLPLWVPVVVGLLALGLGGVGYYGFTIKQELDKTISVKDQLDLEIQGLEEQIQTLEADLESKEVSLEEKAKALQEALDEIAYLKTSLGRAIEKGRIQQKLLDEYRGKYETLNYYNTKYQAEIDRLTRENEELRRKLAEKEGTINQQRGTIYRIQRENEQQSVKIRALEILSASDFRFYAINDRSGKATEADDGAIRQRKIEHFRVCFRIPPNDAARKGATTFYVVLEGPKGTYTTPASSGTFELRGNPVPFSMKTSMDYTGNPVQVCATYPKPTTQAFDKGKHTATVYANGHQIGAGSLMVE